MNAPFMAGNRRVKSWQLVTNTRNLEWNPWLPYLVFHSVILLLIILTVSSVFVHSTANGPHQTSARKQRVNSRKPIYRSVVTVGVPHRRPNTNTMVRESVGEAARGGGAVTARQECSTISMNGRHSNICSEVLVNSFLQKFSNNDLSFKINKNLCERIWGICFKIALKSQCTTQFLCRLKNLVMSLCVFLFLPTCRMFYRSLWPFKVFFAANTGLNVIEWQSPIVFFNQWKTFNHVL